MIIMEQTLISKQIRNCVFPSTFSRSFYAFLKHYAKNRNEKRVYNADK